MKLVSITFKQTPRLSGLRADATSSLDIDNVQGSLYGWRILVRGPMLYLVSPKGWTKQTATQPRLRDKNGPRVVHAIPTADAYLQWLVDDNEIDAVTKGGLKYDTDELGPKTPILIEDDEASILAKIPPHDLGD